jgi:hypothetical protein
MFRVALLLSIVVVAFADHSKMSDTIIAKFYSSQKRANEVITGNVWIFFADKGPSQSQHITLSEKAMARRKKMNIGFTDQDIPVSDYYIHEIQKIIPQCNIRAKSNWLNAISIIGIKSDELEQVTSLSFVKFVEVVSVYSRVDQSSNVESTQDKRQRIDYGRSFTQLNQIKAIEAHNRGISAFVVSKFISRLCWTECDYCCPRFGFSDYTRCFPEDKDSCNL